MHWARFLESVNDERVITKILEKLDNATPKRNDLSLYQKILHEEFQENNCFYCGRKLNSNMHVDHFIPWSFVKTDNLWNLVLACPSCNIKKSNYLVEYNYVQKLEKRNSLTQNMSISKIVENEFANYNSGLLQRIWAYAKMSGFREKKL